LVACGANWAETSCEHAAEDFGEGISVAGAFETSVEFIRARYWSAGNTTTLWPEAEPSDSAALCYLDGPLSIAPPEGPPYDRALVAVHGSDSLTIVANYRDKLPVHFPETIASEGPLGSP
jgi:hypothetical protein